MRFFASRLIPRRDTLRSHLILLVVVTVVPLLVFSAIIFYLFAQEERTSMQNGLKETVRALRQAVDSKLENSLNTLEALAASELLDKGDLKGFYQLCARVLPTQEGWKTINLRESTGKELFDLLRPFHTRPQPVAEKQSFQELLRTKRPVFVPFSVAPGVGSTVGVRVPVLRGNEIQYVLTVRIDPKTFTDVLVKQKLSEGWVATVFDRSEIVVARVPDAEKFVGQPVGPVIGKVNSQRDVEGWVEGPNRAGIPAYAAFSRSEISGYTVTLRVFASVIEAPLRRSLWAVAGVGLACLILGISLAVFIGRRIADPIKSLSHSADMIGRGEAPPDLPPQPVRELESLRRSIEGSGRLVRARRKEELARWESEERFTAIFNQVTTGIAQCDMEGRFLLVNQRYCDIVGRSREELMQLRVQDIIHPDDLPQYRDQIQHLTAGPLLRVERRYVRPDGSHAWVSSGMSLVADRFGRPQFVVAVSQDITDRRRAEMELVKLNEELERRVAERTEELRRTNAELFHTLDQREKLESQLRQAQKMEAIGSLSGGIAHDFNNILGIIAFSAARLREDSLEAGEIAEKAEAIAEATQRGAALAQQLLTFAQEKPIEHRPVDLNSLISDLMKMMVNTFPRTIVFGLDLDPAIPQIVGDQNQLEQALLNLCLNARDAMAAGGKIFLKTARTAGEEVRRAHPGARESLYVRVDVTDTGAGMDEETRKRLFEPFFTTKRELGGTGLGLPVVYGIVSTHGGLIDAESEKWKGTTFHLYFPIRSPAAQDTSRDGETRKETVLVVEDEKRLLALIQSVLEKSGYRVFAATHGEQAVETYRRHKTEIDLVLLDLGLPEIGGAEVYKMLKQENPDVTVVISTGYVDPELRIDLIKNGVNGFLQKPLTPQAVVQKIRSVLDRTASAKKPGIDAVAG